MASVDWRTADVGRLQEGFQVIAMSSVKYQFYFLNETEIIIIIIIIKFFLKYVFTIHKQTINQKKQHWSEK